MSEEDSKSTEFTPRSDGSSREDKPTEVATPEVSARKDLPTEASTGAPRPSAPEDTPESIGKYRILDKLGEGGMGVVYLAEQTEPVQRRVALKVIKLGMDTTEVVARFEAERQALAVMDHPGIATVYDAGATEGGRPYFVMELVRGTPITDYCDEGNLSTRERLELFIRVCRGVQHAHQKGVIHRDLKPSNIIVTVHDGSPQPKIIDFGIAKAAGGSVSDDDETRYTTVGQLLGTPEYMSPEQADWSDLDIDTRTDIYALGVVLYELITGDLPFDEKALRSKGFMEMQRIIREKEPPKPSTRLTSTSLNPAEIARRRNTDPGALTRQLKGDLDWIVMKALEKDRARRYETANGLALEIERFLNNEPVLARPPSTAYRVKKFVRRNYLGVAFSAALAVALVAGFVGTGVGFVRAKREASKATAVNTFLWNTLSSVDPKKAQGDEVTVREMLDQTAETVGTDFDDQPEVEAFVRDSIGRVYLNLGHYAEAERHLERSLRVREDMLGANHEATLETLSQLGRTYVFQERFDEAEAVYSRSVDGLRRVKGARDEDTLAAMNNLVAVYLNQERYEKAEPLLLQVVEKRRIVLGEEHPDAVSSLNNLAHLYKDTGRFDEAEPLMLRALEIRRESLGESHPRTLVSTFNLGELYRETGRQEQAEPLYAEALSGFRRVLGDEHPYVLLALATRADLLLDLGRAEEAEPLAIESYAKHEARYGSAHADTIDAIELLVRLYETLGDAARATEWRSRLSP